MSHPFDMAEVRAILTQHHASWIDIQPQLKCTLQRLLTNNNTVYSSTHPMKTTLSYHKFAMITLKSSLSITAIANCLIQVSSLNLYLGKYPTIPVSINTELNTHHHK